MIRFLNKNKHYLINNPYYFSKCLMSNRAKNQLFTIILENVSIKCLLPLFRLRENPDKCH